MRWLITGGCGFLGANVADRCLERGDEVVVLDNLSRMGSRQNLEWLRTRHGQAWRMAEEDVRHAEGVARLIAEFKPDVVAHLAGQVAMTTSLANPRLDFEVNALGSLNVLEAIRLHSPESIVLYSSTNKVYGDLEWVRYVETPTRYLAPDFSDGFDESIPLSFASPYGCSKGCADQYMLDYARMFGVRTVVFRHSSMYGGRQYATYDQGWVGWFCLQALQTARKPGEHTFTISGNGKQVRDVLHVDDLVRLYLDCTTPHIDQAAGKVFNIGGGAAQSLSILELLKLLETTLNVQLNPQRLPPRASDQKVFVANVARARQVLHWTPRVRAYEGVARMLEWMQTEVTP
ncbi:MAG TPA: CDP-paratose 2-epimerase [Chloroflexi bacterium]|nr:CDP-paratose 2-epimerase [Chloroflexota bacterium]HHW88984.1 NAD-dependent epimerase/dehydratase family protein [Chloroflexota bacterium]